MIADPEDLWFPHPSQATPEGLLCIGGDLHAERLLLAYRSGIFPWFNQEDPVLWWSPPERCVLFPHKLKVSSSMKTALRKEYFSFATDEAFNDVIEACASTPRKGQEVYWITDDMIDAYQILHQLGYAHSAEVRLEGKLVGGLYGVRIGNVFCGESMFSKVSNASKAAFILYIQQLQDEGVALIDCQNHTPHLESLGAEVISLEQYLGLLNLWVNCGK